MTLFLPALLYYLFAIQLYLGKPLPLYGKPGFSKAMGLAFLAETPVMRRLAFCGLGLGLALVLFVLFDRVLLDRISPAGTDWRNLPLWVGSLIALTGGLVARSGVRQEGRATPHLGRPPRLPYPLFLFDLWSLGLPLLITLIIRA